MTLPNLIIAGERRCGTSSLSGLIGAHKDVFMLSKRDGAWFIDESRRQGVAEDDGRWDRDFSIDAYAAMFDVPEAEGCRIIGEKSADYMYWKPAHARIARFLPDVKLVFILRHPVERAWSHYWNEVSKGRETLGFEEALEAEHVRCAASDYERYNFSYASRGDYAASLGHVLKHFSREQVFVTTVEMLRGQPERTLTGLCEFLGIDRDGIVAEASEKRNSNWGTVPRRWAETGAGALLAKAYLPAADAIARGVTRDRERRRQLMVKLRLPVHTPARDVRMAAATRAALMSRFASQPDALADLLGGFDSGWQFDV